MSWYTVAWLAWIVLFLAVEGSALISKRPGATLSEHVWSWFRVHDPRPTVRTWILRSILLIFLSWLALHLGFGWLSF